MLPVLVFDLNRHIKIKIDNKKHIVMIYIGLADTYRLIARLIRLFVNKCNFHDNSLIFKLYLV